MERFELGLARQIGRDEKMRLGRDPQGDRIADGWGAGRYDDAVATAERDLADAPCKRSAALARDGNARSTDCQRFVAVGIGEEESEAGSAETDLYDLPKRLVAHRLRDLCWECEVLAPCRLRARGPGPDPTCRRSRDRAEQQPIQCQHLHQPAGASRVAGRHARSGRAAMYWHSTRISNG